MTAEPVINSLLTTIDRIDLSTITLYPGNPRIGNPEEIAKSLETNGQFAPIIVQHSTRYVLAGNHTVQAAREHLGWTHLDGAIINVTAAQARRILAAANRLAEIGGYDEHLQLALLLDISDDPLGLEGTGYDPAALDDLRHLVEAPVSLDELAQQHGIWEEPTPTPAAQPTPEVQPVPPGQPAAHPTPHNPDWHTVVIACPPHVKQRFDQVFDTLTGEPWQRLEALLESHTTP